MAKYLTKLQACVELLEEEDIEIPSWICFSSVDGENAPSGESFKDCLEMINKSGEVHAVGINYAPPQYIEMLICKFKKVICNFLHPKKLKLRSKNRDFSDFTSNTPTF